MASGVFSIRQQAQAAGHGAWSGSQTTPYVEYLVVAGGGGGGSGNSGGGGGGGGLLQGITSIIARSSITVTVGSGGAGGTGTQVNGSSGCNSVFGNITAIGGGGGGSSNCTAGLAGGSGGGGSGNGCGFYGGQAVFGQGNAGGFGRNSYFPRAGGGGGAGSVGYNMVFSASAGTAGNGGSGIASAISGTMTTYAGGGGGGGDSRGTPTSNSSCGGVGGGGNGSLTSNGTTGSMNTGGGGGGGGYASSTFYNGGSGGSGIVVISYSDTYNAPSSVTGTYTASTSGSGSFTSAGSIQAGGGSGGFLIYPATNQSSFAFGTSNFTIEFFIYPTPGFQNAGVIYDARPSGTQGLYPTILLDTNGTIYYYTNSANQITGSTLSLNTWYHIALTRSGTSTKLFVNGSQVGSTYSDSNTYLNQNPFFGGSGYAIGSNYFQGYMTNARVNNTTAVYTSNFTVPTAPLTNQSGTICLLSSASGSYLMDSSPNQALFRAAGTPYWSTLSPFATGLGYKNRVYTWTGSGTVTF